MPTLPDAIRPVMCSLVIASSGRSPNGTEQILLDCESVHARLVEAKHRTRHGLFPDVSSIRDARELAAVVDCTILMADVR